MRVVLLGRFLVLDGDRDVTPTGLSAIVLKLVICRGGRMHWEEVAEVLWPSAPAERGRTRLRNVLSRLRARSGSVLQRHGPLLSLAPDVQVDVDEFEHVARRALTHVGMDDEEALRCAAVAFERYGGDLLPEDRYAQWTQEPRERLRGRFRAVLDVLVRDAWERGDRERALILLEQAIEVEPEAEELYLDAARLLLGLGRRVAAVRMAQRARRTIQETGLPVSPEWLALEAELHGHGHGHGNAGAVS